MAKSTKSLFVEDYPREILKSEVLRSVIVAVIAFGAMAWFLVTLLFFPQHFPRTALQDYRGISIFGWLALIFVALGFYEIGFTFVIRYFIKKRKKFPYLPRFFNAFIEISTLSMVIFFASRTGLGLEAVFTPTIFLYFVFIALSSLRLIVGLSVFTGFVASAEYLGLAFYLMNTYNLSGNACLGDVAYSSGFHLSRGFILLFAGIITGFVSYQIKKRLVTSLQTMDERNSVVTIFGEHVSPEVVDRLMEKGGDIGSESRYVCTLFLDIRNFTGYCENRNSHEIIDFLNYIFDFLVEVINRNHGIVNKFLGDGFMAVFGAPFSEGNDCENAVRASIEMIDMLEKESAAGIIPPTRIGIGLHAGDVVTGNVGSSRRKEYTIIGDVVNIASRIEQLNKRFSSSLLVSHEVWSKISGMKVDAEDLGSIEIRGHQHPVNIFRIR